MSTFLHSVSSEFISLPPSAKVHQAGTTGYNGTCNIGCAGSEATISSTASVEMRDKSRLALCIRPILFTIPFRKIVILDKHECENKLAASISAELLRSDIVLIHARAGEHLPQRGDHSRRPRDVVNRSLKRLQIFL